MKKSRLLSVLLCLALLSGLLATFASAADSGSAILDEMDVNAKAAVLVDPDTGEILYEKNAHAHNYPASITKVMTCLLTLEAVDRGELSLEQTVTASSALHTGIGEGASTADIKEGEQIRIIDRPDPLGQRGVQRHGRGGERRCGLLRGAHEHPGRRAGHGGHPLLQYPRLPRR